MRDLSFLRALARSFLAGDQTPAALEARAARALGRSWQWLRPVILRYLKTFSGQTLPRQKDVLRFPGEDRGVHRARLKHAGKLSVADWLTEPGSMQPVAAAESWDLPRIESVGALCDWFWLDPGQLEWFADLKNLGSHASPQLQHYRYRALTKPDGSVRLIEAPKRRLKSLQKQILAEILDKIPPHPAAHGFVKHRSIKTFASPHVGQPVVLRMDLRDFFPTFRASRIQTLFRTLGYPEPVADLLGGLCTNAVPHGFWLSLSPTFESRRIREARELYSRPHLPQGAPASPALANTCSYRLDCRLAGLAESSGAAYTRYADDLAFSGGEDFERSVARFSTHVAAILLEEGFAVNHRKTRIMRRGVRQHLAGVVVNQRLNVARSDFDQLKAILTNCIRSGPESQNRAGHQGFRAHLEGRVGFVESISATRGKRLRQLLEQIRWT